MVKGVVDQRFQIGNPVDEKTGFTIKLAEINVNLNISAVLGGKPTDVEKEAFWSLGDVSRDGAVDFEDESIMRDAFGSTPGSPNWNPDCDLNKDGIVDTYDLNTVSMNYGTTIKEASPVAVNVRITGPGIDQTVKTPSTVTLTSTGTYILTCGGQTKTFKLLESDDGQTYDIIFYLTKIPKAEFPWLIPALMLGAIAILLFTHK